MAKHEVESTYRGVDYKVDHVEYGKHKDDAKNDAQAQIDTQWNSVAGEKSQWDAMISGWENGTDSNASESVLEGNMLVGLDSNTLDQMVAAGALSRDEADMLIVMKGFSESGVNTGAEMNHAMKSYYALSDDDQAYVVKQMRSVQTRFDADYQLKNASEKGDDLRHEKYSTSGTTDTMKSITQLLKGMSDDTTDLLRETKASGDDDETFVKDLVTHKTPDEDLITTDQMNTWNAITQLYNFSLMDTNQATTLYDILDAQVNAAYGPDRFATPISDTRTSGFLTAVSVSDDNQATIGQVNAMLNAATSLTDDQRAALFDYYTSGGGSSLSEDQTVKIFGIKFDIESSDSELATALSALDSDPALTDADKDFLTDQLASPLIPVSDAEDASGNAFNNSGIVYDMLQGNTLTAGQSDYVAQLRTDGTYVAPDPDELQDPDPDPDPTITKHDGSSYNTVDVTINGARDAVGHIADENLTTGMAGSLAQAMVDGNLSEFQIAYLQMHANDPEISDDDFDMIASAIAASGGDPTVIGGSNTDEVKVTSAQIDTALADMDDLGLSEDDTAALKQAMLDGTLTPAQGNLLLSHIADANMSSDDAAVVTTAVISSRANAEAIHGAQWDEETTDHKDYDGDGVIGNPWDVGPNDVNSLGLSDTDTMDLASLMFQVMQGRCEALDSTVRSYAKTVQEKNDQIKTMNAAVAAVPTTTSSDSNVDISGISFEDPVSGDTLNLADYLEDQGISMPTSDGSTSLNSSQLSSLRTSMDNASTSLSSDSQLAMTQLQQAMDKYSTAVSMLTNFLSKWYEMLGQIAAKMGQ